MKRILSVLVVAHLLSAVCAASSLLVNGGFETGDFTGWTVVDLVGSSGSFFVDNDGTPPLSGLPTVGPASGSFYAVSAQEGTGTHALIQTFTVPGPGNTVTLSFDMFVDDHNGVGPLIDPAGLDHTGGPNQHARVDILTPAASPFDTGAGVLASLYLGVDPAAPPNPYTNYVFDISGFVGGGGTYQLRFAEVDNQFFLHQGVDNVSIDAVPEPQSLILLGSGLMALLVLKRRSKSRA